MSEDREFEVNSSSKKLFIDINVSTTTNDIINMQPIEYSDDDDGQTTIHIDNEYFEPRISQLTSISNVEIVTLDEVILRAGGFGKSLYILILISILSLHNSHFSFLNDKKHTD